MLLIVTTCIDVSQVCLRSEYKDEWHTFEVNELRYLENPPEKKWKVNVKIWPIMCMGVDLCVCIGDDGEGSGAVAHGQGPLQRHTQGSEGARYPG